jgi:hypothetical protein
VYENAWYNMLPTTVLYDPYEAKGTIATGLKG